MPTHHRIDYLEFTVTDMAAAQAFYRAAFGWSFTDYGPSYAGFTEAEGEPEAGGLSLADAVIQGGPLVVLYSSALEQSRDAVREAGGEIVADIFDFPGGRRFEFEDPSGNRLGVWSES